MLGMNITISGGPKVQARLKALGVDVQDFSKEFAEAGNQLGRFFQNDVFDTQGGVFGNKWAPLKEGYRIYKATSGLNPAILQRGGSGTANMRRAFKKTSAKTYLYIWNSAPYFKYHQSSASRRRLPRRVMLKLDRGRERLVFDILQKGLRSKLK